MKSLNLGLVALSTFSILSIASVVYIDIPHGDIEVKVNLEQESSFGNSKPKTQGAPDDFQVVDFGYERHAGNLSVSLNIETPTS